MSPQFSLNPAQKKAVVTTKGRVLILAGAGSGKTRVIIHRIAHLIKNNRVDPENILGLTFTNKAAQEMRERLSSSIGKNVAQKTTLSTFHSFCMQILRKEIHRIGFSKNFSLYDERDTFRLATHVTKDILNTENHLPSIQPSLVEIAKIKSGMATLDSQDTFTKELYERLQSSMRTFNALDFDQLILRTIELFEKHPDVLEKYQDQYRYIMIDEYQDTNAAQFRLAELLAQKYKNICVVGDDDQSIYGWRGAALKNILEFEADHTIKLEQNYRSTSHILDIANTLISHNKQRHKKNLWSQNTQNEPIEVFHAPNEVEEANAVIQRMIQLKNRNHLKWSDFAILYRSNALSRTFETALIQASWRKNDSWVRGIPYEVFGGLEFSERSEVKDILAYLRVIANPNDEEALLRIINVPRRGISDQTVEKLKTAQKGEKISLWKQLLRTASFNNLHISNKAHTSLQHFTSTLETAKKKFSQEPLTDTLEWFIETIGYKRAIEEEAKSEKAKMFKWENVLECVNSLASYEEDPTVSSHTLEDFISTTALNRQVQKKSASSNDKVQLMTFHSSKGLEFPACFLVGLEDHILPHEKSMMETGVEEERRLFYVGITRAKKYLTMSMAKTRVRYGKKKPSNPSRFLFELPKDLLSMRSYKA